MNQYKTFYDHIGDGEIRYIDKDDMVVIINLGISTSCS